MLTLQNPNYQPPNGYGILVDPGFAYPDAAYKLYSEIEALKLTDWWPREYGCDPANFLWRGMLESLGGFTDATRTVYFILPRASGPGFGTEWAAFHSVEFGSFIYSYDPALSSEQDWLGAATHELFEALTDSPPGSGWVNEAAHTEGADDCETLSWLTVSGYPASSYWSNRYNRCLQQGDV